MDSATQRKRELEEKRQKLAELRRKNEERKQGSVPTARPEKGDFQSIEDVITSIVGENLLSSASSAGGSSRDAEDHASPQPRLSVPHSVLSAPAAAESKHPRRVLQLSSAVVAEVSIPARVTETYSKEVQTIAVAEEVESEPRHRLSRRQQAVSEPKQMLTAAPPDQQTSAGDTEPIPAQLAELSSAQRQEIVDSDDFGVFFSRASRLVERALGQFDIGVDYAEKEDVNDSRRSEQRDPLWLAHRFFDSRWSGSRAITDLCWSPKHPELLAASYNGKADAVASDPDGIVLVWSVNNLLHPEYMFHSHSAVTAVALSRYAAAHVLGGTYSGQILMWDMRAKAAPVQRTQRSTNGHSHPVFAVTVVGSQNAHNVVSMSRDGRLCVWSLAMLNHPLEMLELQRKRPERDALAVGTAGAAVGVGAVSSGSASITASSMCFPDAQVNSFYIGSDDGSVYHAIRHATKAGVTDSFDGHCGPVTALSVQAPALSQHKDNGHLLLSSSTDWTCKLWSAKDTCRPLYSFEHASDYVYDVQWSPLHPALFASVDGSGACSLWNLNSDVEVPVCCVNVSSSALNKVRWAADGNSIAMGDSAGAVHLYNLAPNVAAPCAEDWPTFDAAISHLLSPTAA